jgi:hypothetical protein
MDYTLAKQRLTCQSFHCCDKYLRKQLKRREDLFWLVVSEVSVLGHLALVSTSVLRQNIMVGSQWH